MPEQKTQTEKKTQEGVYVKPELVQYGALEEVTRGYHSGCCDGCASSW